MTRSNIRVSDRKGILWSGRSGLASYSSHKQRYAAVNDEEMTVSQALVDADIFLGRAVKVAPMNTKLKPPGIKRLKPGIYDELLSNYAFKFHLSHYTWASAVPAPCPRRTSR